MLTRSSGLFILANAQTMSQAGFGTTPVRLLWNVCFAPTLSNSRRIRPRHPRLIVGRPRASRLLPSPKAASAVHGLIGVDGAEPGGELSLIIAGSTRNEPATLYLRAEGRRCPGLERFCRNDIVVVVQKERLGGLSWELANDEGIAAFRLQHRYPGAQSGQGR
jgi:hypothetical protein